MGHDYGIDLLVCHRCLIPALVQLALVDLLGNLLGPHPVARAGQEEDYGFFDFHLAVDYMIQITPATSAAGMARTMPIKPPLIWNQ